MTTRTPVLRRDGVHFRPMELTVALLADAANSTANGKLNVLGVFTNMNPPGFPFQHASMTLVLKFEADALEGGSSKNIEVVLVDPDGEELQRLGLQADLPMAQQGRPVEIQAQVTLAGTRFNRSGPHAFVILVNGEAKGRVPLNISEPTQPEADDGQNGEVEQ